MQPVIQIRQLCKRYGDVHVLDHVDIEIASGKLVGFLGPNGAGKSTAIRILMGLLRASSGDCEMFGESSRRFGPVLRRRVGYLPGDVNLYSSLTGSRMLEFLARVRKVNCTSEIDRLAEVFSLPLQRSVRNYSTGMKQKLGLIQAMMHRPDLLVLDEPTSALDPLVRQTLFEELRQFVSSGRTVLFSSHSLDEVETLCDEVIVLRKGRVVEHQTIDVLRGRALRRIEATFADGTNVPDELPACLNLVSQDGNTITFAWSGSISDLLVWLSPWKLDDLIIERPDLNDLFMAYYAEDQKHEQTDSAATGERK